jgi:excisionase family DNA binding protein
MISVAEASRRVGSTPHTIRRWMREGKLRSYRFGMHAMVDETDLARLLDRPTLSGPTEWRRTATGEPMPDVLLALHRSRGLPVAGRFDGSSAHP